MIYIISIISLILDGVISNFISFSNYSNTYFRTFFSLMSLIIIYYFYKRDFLKFILISFIIGMVYDMLYSNTFIINAVLFSIVAMLIYAIHKAISYNLISVIISGILSIIISGIYNYLILLFMKGYKVADLFTYIKSNIIFNVVYILVLYLIVKRVSSKHKFSY